MRSGDSSVEALFLLDLSQFSGGSDYRAISAFWGHPNLPLNPSLLFTPHVTRTREGQVVGSQKRYMNPLEGRLRGVLGVFFGPRTAHSLQRTKRIGFH